jgi:hypothetical protein
MVANPFSRLMKLRIMVVVVDEGVPDPALAYELHRAAISFLKQENHLLSLEIRLKFEARQLKISSISRKSSDASA